MPELSILMPVFNERGTVRSAIEQVLTTKYPVSDIELVIVDDGSTDGSSELVREWGSDPRVRTLSHERNAGKGAAVRTALQHARGDYAAIMDADLEYDPADLAKLLRPLTDREADVVFGTRGFERHSAFSFWYVVGNKGVTLVANLLFNSWLADILMTRYKAMRTEIFRSLDLQSAGFDIEPEITARLLGGGHQIYEVPIRYRGTRAQRGQEAHGTRRLAGRLEALQVPPEHRTAHAGEAAVALCDGMTQEDELWDLQRLAAARGLGDWMFDQFADRVGSDVVEVGAGIGTFTERLLARGAARVLAIEPEPACAAVLAWRFGDDARVTVARELLPDS